jgi:hypothetical protein
VAFADLMAAADQVVIENLGGESVIYRPQYGTPGGVTVIGIVSFPPLLATGDAQSSVQARADSVFFRLADLPIDPEGDNPTLIIRGVAYRVAERQPDDAGGITLLLRVMG